MARGISGPLVASAYLDEQFVSAFASRLGEATAQRGLRALARCMRDAERRLGPASSSRAVLDVAVVPMLGVLGYTIDRLEPFDSLDPQLAQDKPFDSLDPQLARGGTAGSVGFVGVLSRDTAPVATTVTLPWGAPMDGVRHAAIAHGPRHGAPWAIVCNGTSIVILDAWRSWSRRWLAIDLAVALQDERSATLLWAIARAESLADAHNRASFLDEVVSASDRHATAVCASLGTGVMDALEQLVGALGDTRWRSRRVPPSAILDQSITVVYRLLFLLFAEARSLVPTWHRVYREAYTVDTLCRRLSARADVRGVWSTLQAIARLAHAGCAAGDLHVTAFNGRLFAPERSPLAERARIPDGVAGRVLLSLATRSEGAARRPIAYGDLGVEQLGSVYERVLEYRIVETAGHLALERTADDRKATGTFYTPQSLTDFIVRRTLAPLVRDRSADEILSLRIVDPAMGSGAFLVSACRYLARACERALASDPSRAGRVVTDEERAVLRRRVAERCLYGVDINPMAVQVARLSLWLTTLAADRPLTFLDHHLAVGDSLIGARFRDLARQPPFASRTSRTVDRNAPNLFTEDGVADTLARTVLPDRFRLSLEAADTVAAVRDKERRLAALDAPGGPLDRWRRAADLWCAAWFWTGRALSPALVADLTARLLDRASSLRASDAAPWLDRAGDIARALRCFHWELAFPEVFFDERGQPKSDGGFDAVLGNPPWDVLRAEHGNGHSAGPQDVQLLAGFVRNAGIYANVGRGHPNRYQLFVERALQQLRPEGRFGMVVPGGMLTDLRSGVLRRVLLNTTTLDAVVGLDNREAIFPIHRSTRFALLVGRHGGATPRLRCRFGVTSPAVLDELPDLAADDPPAWATLRIDRALIERWDPEHLTIPDVVDPVDLGILVDISRRLPALSSADGWNVRFGRELNATDDAQYFVPLDPAFHGHAGRREGFPQHAVSPKGSDPGWLPVIEGKCLESFRMRLDAARLALPRARVPAVGAGAAAIDRARLAYRDVASATNKLTLIAAMLPAGCVSTHTVFCLKTPLDEDAQRCLMGLLNSLVANYLVRRWVSSHVTTSIMSRLQVPLMRTGSPDWVEMLALVARLEARGIDDDTDAYARLNAIAARLYGLDRDRYAHIVHTFPLIGQHVRDACLAAYDTSTRRFAPRGPA